MSTFLLAVFQLFCIAEVNGCTGLIASVKNLLAPCKAGTAVLSEEAMESHGEPIVPTSDLSDIFRLFEQSAEHSFALCPSRNGNAVVCQSHPCVSSRGVRARRG